MDNKKTSLKKKNIDELEYFVVVPVGFERLAAAELELKLPGLAIDKIEKGGLQLRGGAQLVALLNGTLKIPTAVYARLDRFKVKDFPKLFKKVSQIAWGQWITPGAFELSVSSHGSRLKLKNRIEKTVQDGIHRHFQMQPPKKRTLKSKEHKIEVLVRMFDDECTLSINTSGEALFKRGYKSMQAIAPLRENLAAALYFSLVLKFGEFDEIFDPMAGTGTLLSEALTFYQPNKNRHFAYSEIPVFDQTPTPDFASVTNACLTLVGFDKQAKMLQLANENILNAMSGAGMDSAVARQKIHLKVLDVVQANAQDIGLSQHTHRRVGVVNPPYGERLSLPLPPQTFYPELAKVMEKAQTLGFGWIVPQRYCRLIPKAMSGFECQDVLDFENGGIPVQFQIWARKSF